MKTFALRIIPFTLLALGTALPAAAQSLTEAVQLAVKTNPSVLSAARNREAADAGIGVARGGYFPRLDLLVGQGRERSDNPTIGNRTVTLSRHEESLILNQMLWDGLGTKSEVDRRRAIADSSAHKVYSSAEDVALATIDAYLDVLRNRALVGYAQ